MTEQASATTPLVRAIAAEMGLTAPALYRYVDSLAALEAALADAIHQDVLAALEEAAQRWPRIAPACGCTPPSARSAGGRCPGRRSRSAPGADESDLRSAIAEAFVSA